MMILDWKNEKERILDLKAEITRSRKVTQRTYKKIKYL